MVLVFVGCSSDEPRDGAEADGSAGSTSLASASGSAGTTAGTSTADSLEPTTIATGGTASSTLEDEEEEVEDDDVDVDERGEGSTRIVPRRPGEFLCQSCFLVLPRHMLAYEARMLCQYCV